jgi:hypothetical protein
MPSGVNFQQICSLPYVACREIKEKASVSKQWIVQRCQILAETLTQTTIYNKNFKPFYERSIKPLTLTHKFLLVGVPSLVISVSVLAFYTIGPLACTLSVLVGSIAIPFAWSIPINYLNDYHAVQEALPYVEAIQIAAKKSDLAEAEKNIVALKKLELSCLEKEVKELEEKFNIIQKSVSPEKIKENQDIFIVYTDELSKSLHSLKKEIKDEKTEVELEQQPNLIKNELIDHAEKIEQALEMESNAGVKQIADELEILNGSRFFNFQKGIEKLQNQFNELLKEKENLTAAEGEQYFLRHIKEFREYIQKTH